LQATKDPAAKGKRKCQKREREATSNESSRSTSGSNNGASEDADSSPAKIRKEEQSQFVVKEVTDMLTATELAPQVVACGHTVPVTVIRQFACHKGK
jgi:hypothetical protein